METRERPWQTLAGVLMVLILIPLAFRMQPARFEPFLNLSTWRFLGLGLLLTLEASAIAILASIPLALFFATAGSGFALRPSGMAIDGPPTKGPRGAFGHAREATLKRHQEAGARLWPGPGCAGR